MNVTKLLKPAYQKIAPMISEEINFVILQIVRKGRLVKSIALGTSANVMMVGWVMNVIFVFRVKNCKMENV